MNSNNALELIRNMVPERDLMMFVGWLKNHSSGSFTFFMRDKKIIGHDRIVKERRDRNEINKN